MRLGLHVLLLPILAAGSSCGIFCENNCKDAQDRVQAVAEANLSCKTPEDCTMLHYDIGCEELCDIAVSVEGADALQAAMDDEADKWCGDTYVEADCPFTSVNCVNFRCALLKR
jgi:hypothetical protein